MALKKLSIINSHFTKAIQVSYGKHVFRVYLQSVSGSGNILAKSQSLRWLYEFNVKLKNELFDTSDSYQTGVKSKKYTPTEFAERIFIIVFELIKTVEFKNNGIKMKGLDFIVDINLLKEIKLRDVMLLLSGCIGYSNGFIIRPILTDNQNSRVYSIFTSISSETRKKLKFINYDISAALQTICMHLVKDKSIYPLHTELVNNKYAFRKKVAKETGETEKWVKAELSSADNRNRLPKSYENSYTLTKYFEESQLLRKEVIKNAESTFLSNAKVCAKSKNKYCFSKKKQQSYVIEDEKRESSIFFFLWTQWERRIRESMMNMFEEPEACHQVHDAVYSRQDVDIKMMEKKVFKDTGFKVKICKG